MRRKTVVIGVSYLCGLFLASFLSPLYSVYLLAGSVVVMIPVCIKIRGNSRYIAAALLSFCTGVILYTSYTVNVADKLLALDGQELEITGRVSDYTHIEGDMVSFSLRTELDGVDTTVSFTADDIGSIGYDDTVTVKATLEKISDNIYARTEDYYKSRGILLSGGYAKIQKVDKSGFTLRKAVLEYRDYLSERIMQSSDSRVAGFLVAMLCSDRSQVPYDVMLMLSRTGLLHIFSVSGLHLVIVAFMVMGIMSLTGAGKGVSFVVTELVIVAFMLFAGCAVSVMRAAVMTTLHNSRLLVKRRYDPLASVILACVMLTAFSPYAIRSPSLLLSAAGAFSMAVASPRVIEIIAPSRTFYKLKCTLLTLCTLTVIMFPLSVAFFPEIPLVAIAANFTLVPLCSASLCLTAVVAVTGGIAVIAKPLLMAAGVLIRIVLILAKAMSDLEFASVPIGYTSVKTSMVGVIALALGVFILSRNDRIRGLAALASGYVVCIACAFVNQLLLKDTLRIYRLAYDGSVMLLVVGADECVAVNLAGDGGLTPAVAFLMQSKGVRDVDAFYDLADSTTAYTRFCDSIQVCDSGRNADFNGDLSAWVYDKSVVIEYKDADICISDEYINDNTYDAVLSGNLLADCNESKSYFLFNEIELICIDDDKITVRGLQYGFDE